MNTGSTVRFAHPRGRDTFKRLGEWPVKPNGAPAKEVVELAVEYAVPDIADVTVRVERWRGPTKLETIYDKRGPEAVPLIRAPKGLQLAVELIAYREGQMQVAVSRITGRAGSRRPRLGVGKRRRPRGDRWWEQCGERRAVEGDDEPLRIREPIQPQRPRLPTHPPIEPRAAGIPAPVTRWTSCACAARRSPSSRRRRPPRRASIRSAGHMRRSRGRLSRPGRPGACPRRTRGPPERTDRRELIHPPHPANDDGRKRTGATSCSGDTASAPQRAKAEPSGAPRIVGAVNNDLVTEAQRMSEASARYARGLGWVRVPEHLTALREHVLKSHRSDFARIQGAINDRFGTTGSSDNYINAFYAAAEMALMERVARDELSTDDRRTLRSLWERLLTAR